MLIGSWGLAVVLPRLVHRFALMQVIPMICQPLVRTNVDESGAEGEVKMQKSKGKRKRVFCGNNMGGDEEIAGEASRRAWDSRYFVPLRDRAIFSRSTHAL